MPYRSTLGTMPEEGAPQRRPRLVICSNVLPVKLKRDEVTGMWTAEFDYTSLFEDGPMYAGMRDMDPKLEVLYIGVPQAFIPDDDRDQVTALLSNLGCHPVYCDIHRAHNHFQGYCKGILWPTFHNVIDLYARMGNIGDASQPDPEIHASSGGADASSNGNETSWAPARSWSPMEAEACWPDYCAMQGLFARKAVEIYSEGDTLWVHDYHLLLLPSYLLRRIPNAKIGLFLHVPFPSSEIFRTLATREEILRAMLCADHIGFDLFEYARHFLTSCSRMLGLKHEPKKGGVIVLHNQGREVSITCSHVGHNTAFVHQQLESHEMQAMARRVASSLEISTNSRGGKNIERRQMLLGIDEVEGLRGLGLKLLALDRLFRDYPYLRDRVVLKQIGLKLDSRPNDYRQCHDEVVGLVAHLQKKWGKHVVEYEERDCIELTERLALFQNADVFLNTSVRVGVDMLPFEYLMARRNPAGCIVLSEFSACSRVLHGSLRVNPFKTSALAATIEEALSMSMAERTARCARDLVYIERNTLADWAGRIVEDIVDAHNDTNEPVAKFGGGFGTRLLIRSNEVHKQIELDHVEFCEAFKASKRRVIVLDYSGTLVETSSINMYMKRGGTARSWHYEKGGSRRPGGCLETRDPISDTTRGRIIDLCRDRNNTVVVMSSDLRDELAHALEGIPNLALIAENGFVFRAHPGARWVAAVDDEHSGGGDWYGGNSTAGYYAAESAGAKAATGGSASTNSAHSNATDGDSVGDSSDAASLLEGFEDGEEFHGWQETIKAVMVKYSNRTNGSFVWESPSAVSFNYVLADPGLGSMQASNLQLELEQATVSMPLTVEPGKGAVTVRLHGVNRGTAVRELLSYLELHPFTESEFSPGPDQAHAKSVIDFLACFGDDNEDERAFAAVNKYRAPKGTELHSYSVRVGSSAHSKAKYFVHETDDVTDALGALVEASTTNKIRRNFSQGLFGSETGAGGGGVGNESSIMGNFRTKQSYVTLSNHDTDTPGGIGAGSPSATGLAGSQHAGGKTGLPHTMSYVASSAELADMFGGQENMLGASPSPAALPPTSMPSADEGDFEYAYDDDDDDEGGAFASGPMDPRQIPPSSPSRELGGSDLDDDDLDHSDDEHFGDGADHMAEAEDGEGSYTGDGRVVRETSNGELMVVEDGDYKLGETDAQHGASNGDRRAQKARTNSDRYSSDTLDSAFHKAIFSEDSGEVPVQRGGASSGRGGGYAKQQQQQQRYGRRSFDDNDEYHSGGDLMGESIKLALAALAGASFSFVFLKSSR